MIFTEPETAAPFAGLDTVKAAEGATVTVVLALAVPPLPVQATE